ncbi:MAG: flagellar hook-basal body complex protein FliE [Actinomycetota bacterium]|nr:flagellar hook-basal body complex protein FliE [Actinomycetota bacterium]
MTSIAPITALASLPAIPTLPTISSPVAPGDLAGTAQSATAGASAVGNVGSVSSLSNVGQTQGGSSSFGNMLAGAIDSLSSAQNQASQQALLVSTGQANLGDAMIASQQSSLDTQLATAIKSSAVTAFNQIMSMPV